MNCTFGARQSKGFALVYVLTIMTALLAFASLAVDFGRVQMAKTQLHRAADAAARYGLQGLSDGTAAAKAIQSAAANSVDGTPLVLQNGDVVTGTWSGGTFTPGNSSPNALQVNAHRTKARGTAVTLLFGQVIGLSSCDLNASAVTLAELAPPGGIIGYQGITVKNNTLIASYNSAVTTNPGNSYNSNAAIGSNAVIDAKNNNDLYGSALVGPSGTFGGFTIHTGSQVNRSTAIPLPAMPSWPATVPANPNGVSANFVTNGQTLAAGTYYFNSMTINGDLSFSGPATVYVNGDITVDAGFYACNMVPGTLRVYEIGAHNFGDSGGNGMDVVGDIWAPEQRLFRQEQHAIPRQVLLQHHYRKEQRQLLL